MHRTATLLTVLALASCCLTPAFEGDDAGPCAACPVPDAGGADGGCFVNSDCHKSNPDDCNAYLDMSFICYEGVCTCAGAVADAGNGDGGTEPCTADSDCAGSAAGSSYCEVPLTACPQPNPYDGEVTAALGVCHRSCWQGACTCQVDADCPGGSCRTVADPPVCIGGGGDCGIFTCPNGCRMVSFAEDPCGVCLCAACPAPDAGSGGAVCGLGLDAGACGPNQVCCDSWGGIARPDGGPNGQGCNDLGPDGGCPEGALCAFDGGTITSCDFDYP